MRTLPFAVGLRYSGAASSRRADRAPGRCRAGGGLLGGKDPTGRFSYRDISLRERSSSRAAFLGRTAETGRGS